MRKLLLCQCTAPYTIPKRNWIHQHETARTGRDSCTLEWQASASGHSKKVPVIQYIQLKVNDLTSLALSTAGGRNGTSTPYLFSVSSAVLVIFCHRLLC